MLTGVKQKRGYARIKQELYNTSSSLCSKGTISASEIDRWYRNNNILKAIYK